MRNSTKRWLLQSGNSDGRSIRRYSRVRRGDPRERRPIPLRPASRARHTSWCTELKMTSSELENREPIGKVKRETPVAGEIAGLQHSGEARLADAANRNLPIESRFDLAYNAAHALALAALRLKGY